MRVRDLRWHILACIILIFSYAGIAICFYLSISSGKVQDSMKILGLEAVEEVKNEIENKVDSYFDIFTSNKNDSLVYETGAESTEGKKFELFATQDNDTISTKLRANGLTLNGENSGFVIASAYNIEKQSSNSRNYDYYIYFAKPIDDESVFKDKIETYNTTGYILTRIKLSSFLNFITHDIMIFNTADGNITYTNIDQENFPIKERENYINDYIGDTYKTQITTDGNVNGAYTISGNTFVISALYGDGKF